MIKYLRIVFFQTSSGPPHVHAPSTPRGVAALQCWPPSSVQRGKLDGTCSRRKRGSTKIVPTTNLSKNTNLQIRQWFPDFFGWQGYKEVGIIWIRMNQAICSKIMGSAGIRNVSHYACTKKTVFEDMGKKHEKTIVPQSFQLEMQFSRTESIPPCSSVGWWAYRQTTDLLFPILNQVGQLPERQKSQWFSGFSMEI